MPKKTILINICHHFDESRIEYLLAVINNFCSFSTFDVNIIIDCNDEKIFKYINPTNQIQIIIHSTLMHPFHLTMMHRNNFLKRLDQYEWYMYIEDDILVLENSVNEYINNFYSLYSLGGVPSFVRIEINNGQEYIVDILTAQHNRPIISLNGKRFVNVTNPYHAFWILPQQELKASIEANPLKFVQPSSNLLNLRELASSYVMWELNKTPYVLLENTKFSPLAYSFHLPNNYSKDPRSPHGKLLLNSFTF